MSFIEIVYLSCKCDFSKTHLQYDARILFQPVSFRYTVESRIPKCSESVIKSESHRQILVKKRNFPRYLQLSCKAISLANFFRVQNLKSESRRDSWPKSSWKRWFKTAENGCINGKCNSFKKYFLEIRKLLGLKCPKSPQISKKFIKKWRFEQFEKKIYLQINF